ncbi:hypothetical protein GGX14DRAFT_441258 [Mycena pura]|uniref:Uncharacterized protein n=1 Tax=Mycena pura TaxID=153505 RepID=A0AAD6VL62_9AGAR|nr:hypothetical protein GGX14DRAFT_441258 [Mycena pura]
MNFLRRSFLPVYASPDVTDLDTHSMIIGGSATYLNPYEVWPTCATCAHHLVPLVQLNVSSKSTPDAFRALIPSPVPDGGTHATLVQLFVCPQHDCYDTSATHSTDTRSWVVRIASVPAPLVPPSGAQIDAAIARIKDGTGTGFLRARIVATWTAGKEETLHCELQWGQDDSDAFYAEHAPEPGLKLLGNSVRGEYFCSDDECPKEGRHEHPKDDPLGIMATLGNT